MKLNKNGWGLREMLILSGIIILFLLIAVYFIYEFYNRFEEGINYNYYNNLENKLETQAQYYLDNYYGNNLTSEKLTITRDILQKYDLDINLVDKKDKECSGYVIAYKTHAKTTIKGYIKCPKYETEGYEDWRK